MEERRTDGFVRTGAMVVEEGAARGLCSHAREC